MLELVVERDGLFLGKAARPTDCAVAVLSVLEARALPKDRNGIHHASFAFDDAAVIERAVRTRRAERLAESVEACACCSPVDAIGLAAAADVDAVIHDWRLLRRSCADGIERSRVDAEHVGEEGSGVEGDEEGQGEELGETELSDGVPVGMPEAAEEDRGNLRGRRSGLMPRTKGRPLQARRTTAAEADKPFVMRIMSATLMTVCEAKDLR